MTAGQPAVVVLTLALAGVAGCTAAPRPQAGTPSTRQAAVTRGHGSSPLLSSQPATLSALRAQTNRRPVAIRLPGSSAAATVQARTTDPVTGNLDLPTDASVVVWWASGAAPGDGHGTAVLAAHVAYLGQRGPFTQLQALRAGQLVEVRSADGARHVFRVTGTRRQAKAHLASAAARAQLFTVDGAPGLVLVTCGGRYDAAAGSYTDNVLVRAVPD